MTDALPTVFTTERLALLTHYVKMFLLYGMPLIMIIVALMVATGFADTIISIFIPKKKGREDEDFEYEEY